MAKPYAYIVWRNNLNLKNRHYAHNMGRYIILSKKIEVNFLHPTHIMCVGVLYLVKKIKANFLHPILRILCAYVYYT